jgi:hypothetical protein
MGHEEPRVKSRRHVFLQYSQIIISDEGDWESTIPKQIWLLQLHAPLRGQLSCAYISERVAWFLDARVVLCEERPEPEGGYKGHHSTSYMVMLWHQKTFSRTRK